MNTNYYLIIDSFLSMIDTVFNCDVQFSVKIFCCEVILIFEIWISGSRQY